ncbi:CsbD family protein [Salinimonas iocasae]|uniref:CsbD family protein n=1 Tax=Salinimonas iocasae TaxID=2572577 RepID=A0A5B7Y9V4_9ALTE|nr:CsbD family protein [Salinimonas iocasae]QCZ92106.1 CsbD family protein [Salinimonas iocasae]|tara:strand:- start:428 stop:613 length:186 start_codon:yes stop_codon:yes gene_type:complete
MNSDKLEGNWKEMKGKAQQKWGKLTDDDLDVIDGRREELIGKIQQRYGKSREEAEREVDSL